MGPIVVLSSRDDEDNVEEDRGGSGISGSVSPASAACNHQISSCISFHIFLTMLSFLLRKVASPQTR